MLTMLYLVPQGEGERMVMDLQDVDETLEDAVARSQIKLFGSSSQPLSVAGPSRLHSAFAVDEEDGDEDEDEDGEEDEDDMSEDEDDEGEDEEDASDDDEGLEDDIGDAEGSDEDSAGGLDRGRAVPRKVRRSVGSLSKGTGRGGVEYADSDSDLGDLDDDEDVSGGPSKRVHFGDEDDEADVDIPSDGDEDDDQDDDMAGDEGAPRWKADLGARARASFEQHSRKKRRKDWMKLIYTSSLTPEQILRDDASSSTQEQADADDDDFFTG